MVEPKPSWKEGVFYQIYPRSFMDSNGDGVGDLEGARTKLGYVAALGVDGVWLSPVFASPMRDFGYDVKDYCDVDPLFGDLAAFDRFLAEAHAHGLKVIIDQVYSHTSNDHPWFLESRESRTGPRADWYVWADPRPDGGPPNNWLAAFGGASWTFEPRRRQYYLHNFLPSQPDLDLSRADVQDALIEVARFWLDRGVDGFRLDVANCYACDMSFPDNPPSGLVSTARPTFMQRHVHDRDQPASLAFARRLRRLVDESPGRFTLAELASDDPEAAMALYAQGEDLYHTAYAFRFLSRPFGPEVIRRGVLDIIARAPDVWPSYAFSNHDFERVASRWGRDRVQPAFAKMLFALLTSLRGTPFVYQGEELGLPEADLRYEDLRDPDGLASWPAYKGRDGCRTPMPWRDEAGGGFSPARPWLPIDPAHLALSVSRQEGDPLSMLSFVRRWLRFRRDSGALRRGDIAFPEVPEPLLVIDRRDGADGVRLVFNLGPGQAFWPTAEMTAPWVVEAAAPQEGGYALGEGGFIVMPAPA